ncbi:adenylyl-sulfate kinase [Pseudomonas sp. MMS21-TM103]|uniref:adenylyl-sulfate kinase n=1 Tax=Pseudomonas sp. MMS21 TM103 TaxID=2886506 RepID=UPI001EDE54C9|nr:adenylyl-sulfate kinase [Pseudomonas sp. MMS21 TM103]MCG4454788.1 adenylyl-sulfate kinase [Pseudomonas sp. MMS21 TM103]
MLTPPDREQREARHGHRGVAILLTGLPAAGKSTLARALDARLFALGAQCLVLDGDHLRSGLNHGLGFSESEREENLRRAAEVAVLLVEAGVIVPMAMIAPLARHRLLLAERLGADYREVWCRAELHICERRDPKGHYARARAGKIASFTGVSAPYESPQSPALILDCETCSVAENVERLLQWLGTEGLLALPMQNTR